MKKIKQSVDVTFTCVELREAIVMVPVMDALVSSLVVNEPIRIGNKDLCPEEAIKVYEVLARLGFCTSDGETPEISLPEAENPAVSKGFRFTTEPKIGE